MRIAVPREKLPGEARVALVPESVKKLVAAGVEVGIEAGAGMGAGFSDAEYESAGASVMGRDDLLPAGRDVSVDDHIEIFQARCLDQVPIQQALAETEFEQRRLSRATNRLIERGLR